MDQRPWKKGQENRDRETPLCAANSFIGWEGDQGEAAAGTKRDVSED